MPRTVFNSIDVVPQESAPIVCVNVNKANGNMFLNDGSSILYVYNPGGANSGVCTVTVTSVPDEAGRTGNVAYNAGYQFAMAADSNRIFGPFRQAWWNQTTVDVGYVYVNFVMTAPSTTTPTAILINY